MYRILLTILLLIPTIICAAEKSITAKVKSIDTSKNSIKVADIELEVARKTAITINGKKGTIGDIKLGQNVKVAYDDGLEIATSIVVGEDDGGDQGPTETINLDELNSPNSDTAVCPSRNGLEVFWTVSKGDGNSTEFNIWTARRKNSDSLFTDKKQLFSGHSPVLSSDGLELYFRNADGDGIKLAVRKSFDDDFTRPLPVPSLTFPGQDPAPRWLTEDGLTLYLDMKSSGGPHQTWEVNRTNTKDTWKKPKLVKAEFSRMPKDFRFTQVCASADNLHLYCVVDFPPRGIRIGILSRTKVGGPFTEWNEIPLLNPQGQYPVCLKPVFVPETNELFLVSRQFFNDPAMAEKQKMDLWVIKNFRSPVENEESKQGNGK